MNQELWRREARLWDVLALGSAAMLALALTHCGGNASSERAESGGASIAGGSPGAISAGSGPSSGSGGGAGRESSVIDISTIPVAGGSGVSTCNTLYDAGPSPITAVIAADPPKPEGGTTPNGLFHLARREVFVGRNGNKQKPVSRVGYALLISASTGVSADLQLSWLENPGELPLLVNQSQTLVVSGTSFDYTVTCSSEPAFAVSGSRSFTATANELIWISPVSDGSTYVETFERN